MKLVRYNTYSREDVQSIFAPEITFTRGAGTWGLQGIVKVPRADDDFIFFVTFGQKQGEHSFEEEITENGVLTWQSQPRQDFKSEVIKKLISHDDLKNNIYLFLRSSEQKKYTYLGLLRYVSHDAHRSNPVYFR